MRYSIISIISILVYGVSNENLEPAIKIGAIMLSLMVYVLLSSRAFSIYLFETGIGIKNNWRIKGLYTRKWKYKYHEIYDFEIIPHNDKVTNYFLRINEDIFYLLISKRQFQQLKKELDSKIKYSPQQTV